ncbi:hypothetical protein D3C76_952100 [compost metagenome]
MVEGVRDNCVFRAQQSLEQAAVGVEAGRVENRILHPEECRQLALKLFVAVLGAADKTHGGHTKTVGVHAVFGSGN